MTYPGDALLRATGLVGQPVLGGQTRAIPTVRNEFVELSHKNSNHPVYMAGSGRSYLTVRINSVEVDKDDLVSRAVKDAADDRSAVAFTVEMATGDHYSASWVVAELTYEASSGDVQRIDFTLAATGGYSHTVA
jgi:hypothetical protein